MSKKRLEVYIPVLFKLVDDSAIIHSTLVKGIRENLKKIQFNSHQVFLDIDDSEKDMDFKINEDILSHLADIDSNIESISGYVFYYHHRLIFKIKINYKDKVFAFRKVRMDLLELIQDITNEVVEGINKYIKKVPKTFKDNPDFNKIKRNLDEIKLLSFYSYCVVFEQKTQTFLSKPNQIQTFNIRTLQAKVLPISRTSLLRISIPNMTAYYNGKLTNEYKYEVINTIYKTCLYPKKISELPITEKFDEYKYSETKKHLVIDEPLILDMWTYCHDSFGGKRTDQIGNKGAVLGLVFSLVAVAFSIISFIL